MKETMQDKLAAYEEKFNKAVLEAKDILDKLQFTPGRGNDIHRFQIAAQNIEYWHTRAAGIAELLREM